MCICDACVTSHLFPRPVGDPQKLTLECWQTSILKRNEISKREKLPVLWLSLQEGQNCDFLSTHPSAAMQRSTTHQGPPKLWLSPCSLMRLGTKNAPPEIDCEMGLWSSVHSGAMYPHRCMPQQISETGGNARSVLKTRAAGSCAAVYLVVTVRRRRHIHDIHNIHNIHNVRIHSTKPDAELRLATTFSFRRPSQWLPNHRPPFGEGACRCYLSFPSLGRRGPHLLFPPYSRCINTALVFLFLLYFRRKSTL